MSCYNGEKFIKRSVTSILNQSYKNWELIFWNNNSNDNSEKEILNLNDNRIKYFKSQTTTLLSEARSNAIEKQLAFETLRSLRTVMPKSRFFRTARDIWRMIAFTVSESVLSLL